MKNGVKLKQFPLTFIMIVVTFLTCVTSPAAFNSYVSVCTGAGPGILPKLDVLKDVVS